MDFVMKSPAVPFITQLDQETSYYIVCIYIHTQEQAACLTAHGFGPVPQPAACAAELRNSTPSCQ